MRARLRLEAGLIGTGLDGQPCRAPRLKASHEVGSVPEAEILQRGGDEARLVALVAEDDQPLAEVTFQRWVAVPGSGVKPPFNDVAWIEPRTRNHAVGFALELRTDVDEHRALPHGVEGIGRLHAFKALTRRRQQIVDRHPSSHTDATLPESATRFSHASDRRKQQDTRRDYCSCASMP
jgi:hypothetical protein